MPGRSWETEAWPPGAWPSREDCKFEGRWGGVGARCEEDRAGSWAGRDRGATWLAAHQGSLSEKPEPRGVLGWLWPRGWPPSSCQAGPVPAVNSIFHVSPGRDCHPRERCKLAVWQEAHEPQEVPWWLLKVTEQRFGQIPGLLRGRHLKLTLSARCSQVP